jgi:uncharacterized membrane protein YidH (DUF202 family)
MWSGAAGASAERTRLSWRRTVLATTAVVLLIVRLALREDLTPLRAIGVAAALGGWVAQLWVTQRRMDTMANAEPHVVGRSLPLTALVIVGYAIIGIVLLTS